MTRSRVTAAVAAALCLAVALSGCAASSTPLPPGPTEAEIDAIMAEEVERQVKTNAVSFPEVWEAVEFERFVSSEEMPVVLDECFTGFGAEGIGVFGADGSYSMGTGVMGEFESVVMNACTLAYPDEYQKPLVQTDEQLEYSYNYNVSFVVPCLRAAGYAVESPPSREEYRDLAFAGVWAWSPYNSMNFASDRRWSNYQFDAPELMEGQQQLRERCPPYPEGMEPYN
jgi:hypothetical protein